MHAQNEENSIEEMQGGEETFDSTRIHTPWL